MPSDDVRLDLELAADAAIDRQIQEPKPVLREGQFVRGIQAVAYKNCEGKVPRGVFEARCVARGFAASTDPSADGTVGLDDVHFLRRTV